MTDPRHKTLANALRDAATGGLSKWTRPQRRELEEVVVAASEADLRAAVEAVLQAGLEAVLIERHRPSALRRKHRPNGDSV